jgi:hypothetical protein
MRAIVYGSDEKFISDIIHMLQKLKVDYEIIRHNLTPFNEFSHVIIGGTYEPIGVLTELPFWIKFCNKPILAVDYGFSLLAKELNIFIDKTSDNSVVKKVYTNQIKVRYFANQKICTFNKEYTVGIDENDNCVELKYKNIYAVLFHPENREYYDKSFFKKFLT